MATRKSKTTDEDLLAQLDDIGLQSQPKKPAKPSTSRPRQTAQASQTESDILAELDSLAQRPISRPGTPSLRPNVSSTGSRSPARASTATPPARTSEDKIQRKSNDSTRSSGNQAFTPATTTAEESPEPSETAPAPVKSGGWWGGFTSIASAAVSQVQKAAAEIQKSEDAQRYIEQVKGNVANLRGFGGDLRALAAPTFQNIIQTIAPPISSHERLQIHIIHDMMGYPNLDPLVYAVFARVMAQVEGGDLMVVQRGSQNAPKRSNSDVTRSANSWHDGPWWRSSDPRSIEAVVGLKEGSKLVRASAEGYANEHFSSKGGVEEAAKKATETLSDSNPTRDSEIFVAIQAISHVAEEGLFEGTAAAETETGMVQEQKGDKPGEIVFAVYLHDPIHGIAFASLSQAVPKQWIDWLDAPSGGEGTLPESIEDIISSGGVDPREWVSEWLEEVLSLSVGVVAQRYVARRMGVGDAGAKGKGALRVGTANESIVEAGGGELARAL